MPADCSRNTNGPALPSMIGTSAAVTSTQALSMPSPANADSRCSTVEMRASPLDQRGAERGLADVLRARRNVDRLRQIDAPETDAACPAAPA